MADRNKVAVIQMVSTASVEENLGQAGALIDSAVAAGASLLALPEVFAVLEGGPMAEFAEPEGENQGPIQKFLSDTAKRHGVTIVGGTIPLSTRPLVPGRVNSGSEANLPAQVTGGRVRAASLVFDPTGQIVARYDKLHLFDVKVADQQASYSESRSYEPGEQLATVATEFGLLGLSVCYDLRFPELYRQYFAQGVELLTVPSAFTRVTGEAHWETLLRARAIENQCYVLAPAQGGRHNQKRETWGHSMIVDPWGKVLACHENGPGIAVADVDLEYLRSIRERMPTRNQTRLLVPGVSPQPAPD